MEFLMILTLTLMLTIPLIILFFNESRDASEQVNLAQLGQVTRRLVGSAEAVHALGEPTSVVLQVYIPSGVNGSLITGREINVFVYNKDKLVTVSDTASMNLSGSFSTTQGVHSIRVTAANNSVIISEFSQ